MSTGRGLGGSFSWPSSPHEHHVRLHPGCLSLLPGRLISDANKRGTAGTHKHAARLLCQEQRGASVVVSADRALYADVVAVLTSHMRACEIHAIQTMQPTLYGSKDKTRPRKNTTGPSSLDEGMITIEISKKQRTRAEKYQSSTDSTPTQNRGGSRDGRRLFNLSSGSHPWRLARDRTEAPCR